MYYKFKEVPQFLSGTGTVGTLKAHKSSWRG